MAFLDVCVNLSTNVYQFIEIIWAASYIV